MLRWVFVLLFLAACAAPPPAPAESSPARSDGFDLFVLGIAQDGGRPHLGCDKVCCAEARREGQIAYPVSLGVHSRATGQLLLIEASPQVEAQIALLHRLSGVQDRGRKPVDGIVLTHAHIGHYLGLAQFGREVAGTQATPVWLSPRFAGYLRGNGPWDQLVRLGQVDLREVEPGTSFEPIEGLRVTAIPVPHRDEYSDTMAFTLEGPRAKVLFVPDIDRWGDNDELLDRLLDGVDVAYIDGSFYDGRELPGRNLSEIPHPPIVESVQRLAERASAQPGMVRFIHLNHTNPAFDDPELQLYLKGRGFRIAERGERVEL